MTKLLVILGPTATGKTDLALNLAKKFDGELIAADSRQVFKGLDLISGKDASASQKVEKYQDHWTIDGINIWMYDVAEPKEQFNVTDYLRIAEPILQAIVDRGKLPIIVGGTGLYIKALIEGLSNLNSGFDPLLREELLKLNKEALRNRLESISPERLNDLNDSDSQNPRRLIRAIELASLPNTVSVKSPRFDLLKIGLFTDINILRQRIMIRLQKRFDQGMVKEAQHILNSGVSSSRMDELGLECRYLSRFLNNEIDRDTLETELAIKIGQYAKRQLTWFRADPDVSWFDISQDYTPGLHQIVENWYNGSDANSKD